MTWFVKKVTMRCGCIALGLAIVAIMGLAPRAAAAADCAIQPGAPSGTISYEDRQEILDLISDFSWILDQPNVDPQTRQAKLLEMFSSEFSFIVCSMSGAVVFEATNDHNALFTHLNDIYITLESSSTVPAHIISDTVLVATAVDTVEEKSLLVLTLKEPGTQRPFIDYSAIVRGIIQKNPATGRWQFKRRTIDLGITTASYAR